MIKSFLICFLVFVLIILLLVAYCALRFWAMIKAVVNGNKQSTAQSKSSARQDSTSYSSSVNQSATKTKKIFDANEGEYVEFEEVP